MFFDSTWEKVNIDKIIKDKNIIIFGCSKNNASMYKHIPMYKVQCIFDNDKKKWGKMVDGNLVTAPSTVIDCIVVSASMDYKGLIPQLKDLNIHNYLFYIDDEVYDKKMKKYMENYLPDTKEYKIKNPENIKYLHIFPDQKFILPTVAVLEASFNICEHGFVIYDFNSANPNDIYGTWDKYAELADKYGNIVLLDDVFNVKGDNCEIKLTETISEINNLDKIIFHGEWLTSSIRSFFSQKQYIELLKHKGIWIVWSGKVGRDEVNRSNIDEVLRYCRICGGLTKAEYKRLSGDVKLETKMHFYNGLSYSWILEEPMLKKGMRNVLLGHSCYAYNNILEGLKVLERFKKDINVYAITSYGDADYIRKVVEEGKKIYGERFHPIEGFLPYPEYIELLNNMDIAVWGEEVAAGNTTLESLFWLRKKIYLKDVAAKLQREKGYGVYDFDTIINDDLDSLWHNDYEEQNYQLAKRSFKKDILINRWRELFELDMKNI